MRVLCKAYIKYHPWFTSNIHLIFRIDMNLKHACRISSLILGNLLILGTSAAFAATVKGVDYSGEYLCKGNNEAVGDYEVSVILKKSYRHSRGGIGIYELATETENNETYTGQAVTNGNQIALTFKLSSARHAEFSTGVGQFKKVSKEKWSFKNNYFEPDDTGGNYGSENCVMRKNLVIKSAKIVNKK